MPQVKPEKPDYSMGGGVLGYGLNHFASDGSTRVSSGQFPLWQPTSEELELVKQKARELSRSHIRRIGRFAVDVRMTDGEFNETIFIHPGRGTNIDDDRNPHARYADAVVAALNPEARIVTIANPGIGNSSSYPLSFLWRPSDHQSFRHIGRYESDFIGDILTDGSPLTMVGTSQGANIMYALAHAMRMQSRDKQPFVDAMVAVDPLGTRSMGRTAVMWNSWVIEGLHGRRYREATPDQLLKTMLANPAALARAACVPDEITLEGQTKLTTDPYAVPGWLRDYYMMPGLLRQPNLQDQANGLRAIRPSGRAVVVSLARSAFSDPTVMRGRLQQQRSDIECDVSQLVLPHTHSLDVAGPLVAGSVRNQAIHIETLLEAA